MTNLIVLSHVSNVINPSKTSKSCGGKGHFFVLFCNAGGLSSSFWVQQQHIEKKHLRCLQDSSLDISRITLYLPPAITKLQQNA